MSKPSRLGRYTYADYLTWDASERWELIDGVTYLMSSPTPEHQQAAIQLATEFTTYLRGKECQAYIAPMDLVFDDSMNADDVVQPDLFIMCGEYGRDKRIVGIPSLVVEILSPSTEKHDLIRKLHLYQKMNVPEYWIVDTDDKTIHAYIHNGTALCLTSEFRIGDTLSSVAFPDMNIHMNVVFP